jgi:crotonobetainyl-CoA:carnitine CoA-transferase CaiB-like acyl-CoA transferase
VHPLQINGSGRGDQRRSGNDMAEHVIERLDNAQIANARMNDMQVWEHAQLKARKRWVESRHLRGKFPRCHLG